MSSKEKYDHLANDYNKVRYRMGYYHDKAIKEIKRANIFPAWKTYDYIAHESNNKYVIVFFVDNPYNINNPKVTFFLDYHDDKNNHYVVRWGASPYKQTPDSPFKLVRVLHVYEPHFLNRYKERFLKDNTLFANEVASRFLSRNDISVQIEITEEINRNIGEYGKFGKLGYRVKDGMCFAKTVVEGMPSEDGNHKNDKVEAICIMYKTFVNDIMLFENHNKAIMQETWDKWTKSYIDFINENNGNDITLTLEP
jgi:hypothetical protein